LAAKEKILPGQRPPGKRKKKTVASPVVFGTLLSLLASAILGGLGHVLPGWGYFIMTFVIMFSCLLYANIRLAGRRKRGRMP
jgi:hypothetical protein